VTTAIQPAGGGAAVGPSSSDLADVIETILDKGLVIDAHVSVAVVGIRILTIDARIVVASVDTYLRFAEAVNRLDLSQAEGKGLPEVVQGPKGNLLEQAGNTLGEIVGTRGRDRERERLDLSEAEGKGLPEVVRGPKGNLLEEAGDTLGEIVGSTGRDRERAPRRRRLEED
jgi:gas vesicle structural protein